MRAATSDSLRRGATTRLHATRRVNWSCKSSFWVEITLLASCRECHSPWVLFSAGVRSPTRVATHCVCLQWWGQDAGPGHSASDQDAVFRAIKILSSAPRPPSGRSCPVPLSTFGRYWPPGSPGFRVARMGLVFDWIGAHLRFGEVLGGKFVAVIGVKFCQNAVPSVRNLRAVNTRFAVHPSTRSLVRRPNVISCGGPGKLLCWSCSV